MENENQIGLAGYFFLAVFCVLLPLLVVKSSRRLMTGALAPWPAYFISVVSQQIFFAAFSLWVAYDEAINLFTPPPNPTRSALVGAAFLAVMIVVTAPRWRHSVEKRERRLYYFMPRTPQQKLMWAVLSLFAGVGEEIAYRGVMFVLFSRLTGAPLTASLLTAVVFAFCHYVQGWKSMAVIFLFALSFQALVYVTGTLFVAMAVHFLYDVTAGMMYGYFGDKLGYPIEGIQPEGVVANAD
jgi:membrane protease YdiL (CAAX protease family)